MRIEGAKKSLKKVKSPAAKKRKAFSKLKKDLFKQVKKICRDRMPCIMANQEFGNCGGVVCASHIKSVGAWPNLSHDPNNIFPMCYRHHIQVWHKDVTETGLWFKTRFPVQWKYLESAKHLRIDLNNPIIVANLTTAANAGFHYYADLYGTYVSIAREKE